MNQKFKLNFLQKIFSLQWKLQKNPLKLQKNSIQTLARERINNNLQKSNVSTKNAKLIDSKFRTYICSLKISLNQEKPDQIFSN